MFLYPEEERVARLHIAGDWLLVNDPSRDDRTAYSSLGKKLGNLVPQLTGSLLSSQTAWVAMFNANVGHNCMPYEGAFVGRQFPGILQGRLLQEYGEAGLVTGEHQEPDHCAVELEFMSHLCNQEAAAGDENEKQLAKDRQKAFLRNHLLVWFPLFAKRSQAVGSDDRYLQLINLTNQILDVERKEILQAA